MRLTLTLIDGSIYTIHEMENLILEYKEIRILLDKVEITHTKSNINKIKILIEEYERQRK